MRNFGRGGICHEPSHHHSQFSDIRETSLCDIPTLVQYAVKQGIAEDGLEVENGLCEWGEPNVVTDFEDNLVKEYCHQHTCMRVKEQLFEKPESSDQSASYQRTGNGKKIKRD